MLKGQRTRIRDNRAGADPKLGQGRGPVVTPLL